MTASDAIMLAQLCATLLVASSVAHISAIRNGSPVTRLSKFSWYWSVISLTISIGCCLLVAAFAGIATPSLLNDFLLYGLVVLGAAGTAASIWGQIQFAVRRGTKGSE